MDPCDELYTSFVLVWADDVGGNVTKLINAHRNIYLAQANVPGRLLQQEYFACFVGTSQVASTAGEFEAVKQMVEETHVMPLRVYQAHIGGKPEERESNEGYHTLHAPGVPRTVEGTQAETCNQLHKAMEGSLGAVTNMQTALGTEDWVAQAWILKIVAKVKELRSTHPGWSVEQVMAETQWWLEAQPSDPWSPLLSFHGLDPHWDTPMEILHTVLLGAVKYVWHQLHVSLSKPAHALFVVRLQSTNVEGLSIPEIWAVYMSQYRNGLVGKHFKSLMQTMLFTVHGIVTGAQFHLINALGKFGAVLWYHEIPNIVEYLV
ncbi:hypothetical protein K439DRAFT_1648624 [Ramaria rubella]|nr:hypothetical protein K439DRAFT_1648624 [Ramaria rubella]